MFYIGRKSETVVGMDIWGNSEFRRCTRAALRLLEPLVEYKIIDGHLGSIRQGKRSGVTAWAERPVFTVAAPTWKHSSIWYASAIAHDAYHPKLYRDAKGNNPRKEPPVNAWSGKAAERACLLFQRQVLVSLGADKSIIEYVEKHAENPTYQGRNKGWRGWLDYHKRWW
jgi:hypothetical protein